MIRSILLAAGMAIAGTAAAAAPAPATYELALVDMQGQKKVLGILPEPVFAPRVSPDGRKVAYEGTDPELGTNFTRLYVAQLDKLDKPTPLEMTVTARRNVAPVWSADGNRIAFLATGNGPDTLYWQLSDGWIQPIFLMDGRAVEGLYEGDLMAFITLKGNRDYGISLLDIKTKKVTPIIDLPGSEQHSSRISPDGKWIVYVSNETGRQEAWLEPLPQTGKRYQLTTTGGRHPVWSPDGSKLYFDQGGRMFAMSITTSGAAPVAGAAAALPISGFHQGDLRRQFDLMPDGKSFLMLFPVRGTP